jgi:hypothetical protein
MLLIEGSFASMQACRSAMDILLWRGSTGCHVRPLGSSQVLSIFTG